MYKKFTVSDFKIIRFVIKYSNTHTLSYKDGTLC